MDNSSATNQNKSGKKKNKQNKQRSAELNNDPNPVDTDIHVNNINSINHSIIPNNNVDNHLIENIQQIKISEPDSIATAPTKPAESLANSDNIVGSAQTNSPPLAAANKSYLASISAYIPSSFSFRELQSYVTNSVSPNNSSMDSSNSSQAGTKNIVFKSFESYEERNEQGQISSHQILLLGLKQGFQLYKVFSATDVRLISQYSTSNPVINLIILPNSKENREDLLLALIDPDDSNAVSIFSCAQSKFIHQIKHKSRVHDLKANETHLVTALESEIYVYGNNYTGKLSGNSAWELIFTTKCYPNPADCAVFALGARWLAYSPWETAQNPSSTANFINSNTNSPTISPSLSGKAGENLNLPLLLPNSAKNPVNLTVSHTKNMGKSIYNGENLSNLAKGALSGLYNVGNRGKKTLESYLQGPNGSTHGEEAPSPVSPALYLSNSASSSPPSGVSSLSSPSLAPGLIIVRDLQRFDRVVASIKAHNNPISALFFDSTGSLLLSCSTDAQYLHVYQVVALPRAINQQIRRANHRKQRNSNVLPKSNSLDQLNYNNSGPNGANSGASAVNSGPNSANYSVRFLYKLFRGVTHATIRCVHFSHDSKWLAVVSKAGTTHIFPINLHGNAVNATTHGPSSHIPQQNPSSYTNSPRIYSSAAQNCKFLSVDYAKPCIISAVLRIKPQNYASNTVESLACPNYVPVIAKFARFAGDSGDFIDNLLVCTFNEELIVYSLATNYRTKAENCETSQNLAQNGSNLGSTVSAAAAYVSSFGQNLLQTMKNNVSSAAEPLSAGNSAVPTVSTPIPSKIDLFSRVLSTWNLSQSAAQLELATNSSVSNIFTELHAPNSANSAISNSFTQNSLKSRDSSPHSAPIIVDNSHSGQNTAESASKWLNFAELRTFSSSEVAFWASPQFHLQLYSSPSSNSGQFIALDSEKPQNYCISSCFARNLAYEKQVGYSGLRGLHQSNSVNSGITLVQGQNQGNLENLDQEIDSALQTELLENYSGPNKSSPGPIRAKNGPSAGNSLLMQPESPLSDPEETYSGVSVQKEPIYISEHFSAPLDYHGINSKVLKQQRNQHFIQAPQFIEQSYSPSLSAAEAPAIYEQFQLDDSNHTNK
jgi:hypothetical protein